VIWRFNIPQLDPEASLTEQARTLRQRMREELGEDKARRIWDLVGRKPRGRIPGKHVYDVSRAIELYDSISKRPDTEGWTREEIARSVAELAHAKYRGQYGSSVAAITKRITRELKERDKRDAELQAQMNTWRSAMGPSGSASSRPTAPLGALAAALLGADKKSE
jgi:hypothetical protein